MILYQSMIHRGDLIANRNVFYIFGDNEQRQGFGGQAKEMRGEPNAIGVATKKAPGMGDDDFFNDDEYERNIQLISADFNRAAIVHNDGGVIVVPANGIGTGFSQMPERCPCTFAFLCGLGLGGTWWLT